MTEQLICIFLGDWKGFNLPMYDAIPTDKERIEELERRVKALEDCIRILIENLRQNLA